LSQLSIVLIGVNINQKKTLFKVDFKKAKQHIVCLFTLFSRSPKPLIPNTYRGGFSVLVRRFQETW